ncbi:MAG TPA: MFS transporter, partial [Ilumatobacteraceae bacterium]|nr:MFS transporter [Ilumatobacteraceae bacterium]
KQRMAVTTQSLQALQAFAMGALTLTHHVNLPTVYALSLALGVVAALDNPARRGFVTELVEPDEIANAVSLNTAVMTGSRIFGPALAASLVTPLHGAGWLFMLNGASFVAIIWPLLAIDRSKMFPAPVAKRGGTPVRDAVRFITRDRRLLTIFVVFTLVGTFAFNYSVSLLKLADQHYDGKHWYGWLLASTGLGSMIGSLLTAARQRVTTRWFLGNGVLMALMGFVVAWAPTVWFGLLMSIPLGMGGAALIAAQNAIVQQESPPDMRGRLLALGAVAFLGSTPIGAPITGWIADHISSEWSLAYGSAVTLMSVALGAVVLRRTAPVVEATDLALGTSA